jgi:hypothetical protein
MPTLLREGGYRFFITAHDWDEPPHVHVTSGRGVAKFWLSPIVLADDDGYSGVEVRRMRRIIEEHQAALLNGWHDFFAQP